MNPDVQEAERRRRGGPVESDDRLPFQRESIYTQFEGDPERGFVSRGITHSPDPLRVPGNFTGKGPKGYRRADQRIREEVCEALSDHPEIDASDLEVAVHQGIVTLTGTVLSRRMKFRAEDAIERIVGVDDVENLLRIAGRRADERAADAIGRSNLRFGAGGSTRAPNGRSAGPSSP